MIIKAAAGRGVCIAVLTPLPIRPPPSYDGLWVLAQAGVGQVAHLTLIAARGGPARRKFEGRVAGCARLRTDRLKRAQSRTPSTKHRQRGLNAHMRTTITPQTSTCMHLISDPVFVRVDRTPSAKFRSRVPGVSGYTAFSRYCRYLTCG